MPDMRAPDRRPPKEADSRVAVIDLGSNSVRLVIYDRLDRTPLPIFNEKQMCALGRGMATSGRLNKEGKALTLKTLDRFAHLLQRLDVKLVLAVATAALREAEDGPAFVEEIERTTGLGIQVISGDEEARFSALGVISGMPQADGVVGDLGGGSLELVRIHDRDHENQISLPLGPFKFPEKLSKRNDAVAYIRELFGQCDWLPDMRGKELYAVGGAWRSLAKLHMEQVKHPLHIVHSYRIPLAEALSFTDLMSKQSRNSLERMGGVSTRRVEVMPHAALLMNTLLEVMKPRAVMFSSYGLREGLLYDRLDAEMQAQDPLLYSCRAIEARTSRFDGSRALFRFTAPLFGDESQEEERLRRASCLLSDFCWSEHPDYRAEHGFLRVLRSNIVGIDHQERVFLATVLHRRYGGKFDAFSSVLDVLDERQKKRAELLGNALRLGHALAGGAENVLDNLSLSASAKKLVLNVPKGFADLVTDIVERRLGALAKAMDAESVIEIGKNKAA